MPNIGLLLKQEIARLAKKEAKGLVKPASEHFTGMRKLVSQMKKKIAALEKKVAALEKSFAPKGIKIPAPESVDKLRLGPSNIAKLRAKLGLSRGEMAKLIKVSQNSVFLWEKGEAKPRAAAKAKIIALRDLGKRDVRKLLGEGAAKADSAETSAKAPKAPKGKAPKKAKAPKASKAPKAPKVKVPKKAKAPKAVKPEAQAASAPETPAAN